MAEPEKEYVLYCDESVIDGQFYSNFYGGLLVGSSQLKPLSDRLNAVKAAQNLHGEVKWRKVTDNYLTKYIELVNALFNEIEAGHIKVRIMFRQNARKSRGLSQSQVEQTYYILYYQFIKYAFGFGFMPRSEKGTSLRLYFDQFPDTGEQVSRFRGFILGLNRSKPFHSAGLVIHPSNLSEVSSHEHVLLQCLDVVLGAMAFRLNDLHKVVPEDSRRRGKRTIAKEKLYKHILARIRILYPNFNIGITTGGAVDGAWEKPYRHWAFTPKDHEFDRALTKGQKK